MSNPEIHFSEISTFLKCKKLHELSYIKRIEPRVQHNAISFGTFGHKALETLIRTNGDEHATKHAIRDLWQRTAPNIKPEQKDEYRKIAQGATIVAIRAWKWLNGRLVTVTHNDEKLIEKHLRYTVDGIDFIGTPDWIVEDTVDHGIWVVDHKFRKTFREAWSEDLNLQMIFYQGLTRYSIGLETVGTKQLQIKPIAPQKPELTDKGKVSQKDIYSTWDIYSKFVEEQGDEPLFYLNMKKKLDAKIWFDLDGTRTYRDTSEVDQVWQEVIIPTAKEIVQRSQNPVRCYDFYSCKNCNVRDFCVGEAKGIDVDFLMQTSFKFKDEKDSNIDIEFIDDEEDLCQ